MLIRRCVLSCPDGPGVLSCAAEPEEFIKAVGWARKTGVVVLLMSGTWRMS